MSSFLKNAADAAKEVEAARKARAKAEAAAEAKFAKALETFEAAKATQAKAIEEAAEGEAGAWRAMMEKLGVGPEMAAQIVGVDAGAVKAVLAGKTK